MKKIGLVASTNGLGHARRILHIAIGFIDIGHEITLFITKNQALHLRAEISKLKFNLNLVEIKNHGLDGPAWFKNGASFQIPSKNVISKLRECDFILSDNLTWPFVYNNNFGLIGHFYWHDYWQKTENLLSSKLFGVFERDFEYLLQIPLAFQFEKFILYPRHFSNKVMIKLPKYYSDIKVQKKLRNKLDTKQVWLSKGTTGLWKEFESNSKILKKFSVLEQETYRLGESKNKPKLVIGRPGLGTIRDCLAAGIPFFPIWNKKDPELNSNVNHLINLGLNSHELLMQENLDVAIEYFLSEKPLLDQWEGIWSNLSVDLQELCLTILSNFK